MQDQYVGDIADYARSALLRALSKNRQLGVAWYLRPDAGNTDGKHIDYLKQPEVWRRLDEGLFDGLKDIIDKWKSCVGERSVAEFEKRRLLPTEVFAGKLLHVGQLPKTEHAEWRHTWFKDVIAKLEGCDIVFADPDKGLYLDKNFDFAKQTEWEYLPLSEAEQLAKGRTAIFYHTSTRWPRAYGGHLEEIRYCMKRLPGCTHAFYCRRYSPARTFFVLNADDSIVANLTAFVEKWREAEGRGKFKSDKLSELITA